MSDSPNQIMAAKKPKPPPVDGLVDRLLTDDAEDRWEGDGGYVWIPSKSPTASPFTSQV